MPDAAEVDVLLPANGLRYIIDCIAGDAEQMLNSMRAKYFQRDVRNSRGRFLQYDLLCQLESSERLIINPVSNTQVIAYIIQHTQKYSAERQATGRRKPERREARPKRRAVVTMLLCN